MSKKRILFVGEASFLSTGFSTYYRELLPRLAATGKYEIAELGSYAQPHHPGVVDFIKGRWKFYGTMPECCAAHNQCNHPEGMAFRQPSHHPRDKGQNINQFGAGAFDAAVADFKPDIVCVPPGEMVFTSEGYKPIEEVQIGERVHTHTGACRVVTDNMRRQHTGHIRSIYINGCAEPLRLTDKHPVLVYKQRKQSNQKKRIDEIYAGVDPEFVPANEVKSGDLVVFPNGLRSLLGYWRIDVTKYLKNFLELDNHVTETAHDTVVHRLSKDIVVDPEFARLVGYLLSDGSYKARSVSICFGGDEKRFVDDAISLFAKLGIEANYTYGDGGKDSYTVRANSSLLAEFFRSYLKYKHSVPVEFWHSPSDVREQLISGLVRGDGSYKKYTISFSSTFKWLAYNVRALYFSLGIPCTLTRTKRDDVTSGRVYEVNVQTAQHVQRVHGFVQKYDLKEQYSDVRKSAARVNLVNDHIVASVRRNRITPYRGQVYNLEVEEDNSYILQSCVHNCDIRDNWMLTWQLRSPFRPWFKLLWMPTVDAEPQQEEWVEDYEQADMILSYSDYGIDTLKRQSPMMRVFPTAMRPGVDIDVFKKLDNASVREKFLLDPTVPIIGTVMRNQSRKLYPDLINAFAHMKNLYADKDEAVRRAVLLIHSSWPDNQYSYDYPRHITRLHLWPWMPYARKGIKDDVLQTLICHNPECGKTSLGHAQMLHGKPIEGSVIRQYCKHCNEMSATCPTSGGRSLAREELAEVYNLMDLYVQCSICFTGDTPVLTSNGWESISDITENTEVIGRDGLPHRVYKTMHNKTDSLVGVKLHGSPFETECTPNHPFLVVQDAWPNDKRSLREKIAQKSPSKLVFKHKDAGDLVPGDMCVQTIPVLRRPHPLLEIGGESVEIDKDMAWFLGVMIGDGNVNINPTTAYCRVTCALDDDVVFDKVDIIARRFNHEAKRRDYVDRKAFDVNINYKALALALREALYTDDKTKKMPDGFEFWPANLQKALIDGLIHADGHTISETVMGFTGTSVHVARSLYLALQRLGLSFNAHQQYPANRKTRYKFEINMTGERSSTSNMYWSQDDVRYLLSKVRSVEDKSRDVEVFNIDVEDDHNYVVCGHTVHNCEGDGMPIQEAKSCGVPTLVMDYTAMREKGRFPEYDHFKKIGVTSDNYSCQKGGEIIKVGRYYEEPETSCMRALPDIDDLAHKMREILVNDERRKQMSREARECVEENYDWDKVWKRWEFVLDKVQPKDRSQTWDTPIVVKAMDLPTEIPENLDEDEFFEWLYTKVLKYPRVDPNGVSYWKNQVASGATREMLLEQFRKIASQGGDTELSRQRIRAAVAKQKGETFIDETEEEADKQWV